jgi:uncharacterized protein (TIGR02996 family)
MTQDESLLRAICDNPDDDAVRLVYADWLEDQGHSARPEFIRVQVELARLPFDDERVSPLQAREFRLLSRHGVDWLNGDREGTFTRGFREEWKADTPILFAMTGEKLLTRGPLRKVVFGFPAGHVWGQKVAEAPHLSFVETIALAGQRSGQASFSDILALLSSPRLTRLRTLDLGGGHELGDEALSSLLRSCKRTHFLKRPVGPLPSLRNLLRLSLNGMQLTDAGLRVLVESPLTETLVGLDLSDNDLTDEAARILTDSRLWPRLQELNLGKLFLSEEAIKLLAEALPRSNITRLGLGGAFRYPTLPVALAEALASAPSWGKLEALDLSSRQLEGVAGRILAACPHLAGLRWLNLDSNYFEGDDVVPLVTSRFLSGLTTLSIYGDSMNDSALEALAGSPHAPGLAYLNVDASRVGVAGAVAFARSPAAGRLRIWDLPPEAFLDETLFAVADSPHLGRLTSLLFGATSGVAFEGDGPTDAGALALVQSPNLPNLAYVEACWNRLTEAGVRALLACDRLASFGWAEVYEHNQSLLLAHRDRFGEFNAEDMLPGANLRMFPWAKHAFA